MKESVFVTFKVWHMNKLSEKECRDVAVDHFYDIVDTFGLDDNAFLEPRGKSSDSYMFRIIEGILPRGKNNVLI